MALDISIQLLGVFFSDKALEVRILVQRGRSVFSLRSRAASTSIPDRLGLFRWLK